MSIISINLLKLYGWFSLLLIISFVQFIIGLHNFFYFLSFLWPDSATGSIWKWQSRQEFVPRIFEIIVRLLHHSGHHAANKIYISHLLIDLSTLTILWPSKFWRYENLSYLIHAVFYLKIKTLTSAFYGEITYIIISFRFVSLIHTHTFL